MYYVAVLGALIGSLGLIVAFAWSLFLLYLLRCRRQSSRWPAARMLDINYSTALKPDLSGHSRISASFSYEWNDIIYTSHVPFIGSTYDSVTKKELELIEDQIEKRSVLVNPNDPSQAVITSSVFYCIHEHVIACWIAIFIALCIIAGLYFYGLNSDLSASF
jgi:hypothetical protein